MKEELISIITPVYNSEKYIERTIESVINQTYKNWEMILVDDCSTDNSESIVKKYSCNDQRIKYYRLKENSGAGKARNLALEKAKGTYIAYLDSDDIWKKEKLEKQLKFMKSNKYAFSCTSYEKIDENDNYKKTIEMPKEINYKFYLRNTIIQTVGVMVNVNIVGKETLKMPDIRRRQDAATWCQVLKKGFNCYGMKEVLACYRVVSNSLSSNKIKAAKGTWFLYRKIENLSIWKSSFYFIGYAFNAIRKRIYLKKDKKNLINFYGPIDDLQGPGIKNKNTLIYIKEQYNVKEFNTFDTSILNRIKFLTSLIFTNRKVIIAVSSRGRKIICPILKIKHKLNKNFSYIFIIINGYITTEIEKEKANKKNNILYALKNSKMIFVEIKSVKENLEKKYDLTNVTLFENFKLDENYIKIDNFNKHRRKELRLVFLARVCKEKGIDFAVNEIKNLVNNGLNITLDIYGPIFKDSVKLIDDLKDNNYIKYRGIAKNEDVTKILKDYDIYVFPTKYKREGFPATLIDAYSAALPVIASDVCFNKELIADGKNGYIYNHNDKPEEKFKEIVENLYNDNNKLKEISKNNYMLSQKYRASVVLNQFMQDFNKLRWNKK